MELSNEFKLTFLLPEKFATSQIKHMETFGNIIKFKESKILEKISRLILARNTFMNRQISISFETRIKIIYPELDKNNERISQNIDIRRKIQRQIVLTFVKMLPGNRLINLLEKFVLTHSTNIYSSLKNQGKNAKILILSGGAYSGFESSVISNSKKLKIKNLLLIDNWDNLSSKSIILFEPNATIVWGDEMAKEVVAIHKFTQTNIFKLKPLRFNFPAKSTNPFSGEKYVLFSGSGGLVFPELDMLEKCANELNKLLGDIKLIYRPHPSTISNYIEFRKEFSIRFKDFRNVEIDSSINEYSAQDWYSLADLHRVDHLIKNCEFVITPHSTMLIEAHFNGKPAVALSSSILENKDSPKHWYEYQHLVDYRKNPLLILVEDAGLLKEGLTRAIKLQSDPEIIRSSCQNYISDSSLDFIKELINIIEESESWL